MDSNLIHTQISMAFSARTPYWFVRAMHREARPYQAGRRLACEGPIEDLEHPASNTHADVTIMSQRTCHARRAEC